MKCWRQYANASRRMALLLPGELGAGWLSAAEAALLHTCSLWNGMRAAACTAAPPPPPSPSPFLTPQPSHSCGLQVEVAASPSDCLNSVSCKRGARHPAQPVSPRGCSPARHGLECAGLPFGSRHATSLRLAGPARACCCPPALPAMCRFHATAANVCHYCCSVCAAQPCYRHAVPTWAAGNPGAGQLGIQGQGLAPSSPWAAADATLHDHPCQPLRPMRPCPLQFTGLPPGMMQCCCGSQLETWSRSC